MTTDAYRSIPGWFGADCAAFYHAQAASAPSPAHFVEVGSWQGRSAAAMAEAIRDSGKLIRFDCVDTWQGSPYGRHPEMVADLRAEGKSLRGEFEANLRGAGLWRYVNPVTGDSPTVAADYEDESLDFVFIDGDHHADKVEADCRAWWPKLKRGGVLAGHDAQNPMVRKGLVEFLGHPAWAEFVDERGIIWTLPRHPSLIEGYSARAKARSLHIPSRSPGCELWRPYIKRGCRDAGIECVESEDLVAESHFLPPGSVPEPGKPYHVAAFAVDGRRAWFDFSDFTGTYCTRVGDGATYFKKQCPSPGKWQDGLRPIGQYIPKCERYLPLLPDLRGKLRHIDGTAHFSNIDERNNPPLRRQLVEHLQHRQDERWDLGLWRFSRNRPAVPPAIERPPLDYGAHLNRVAASRLVFALPGVGGDSTRNHAETLGIGSCLVTVKTEQLWPGNWRGCWAEIERDLSNVDATTDRLLSDADERKRVARLGLWYWEANLRPDRYVERICGS